MSSSSAYSSGKSRLDWVTIALFVSLLLIGWLMVYASVYDDNIQTSVFSPSGAMGMQTIWVGISIAVFIMAFIIDWKFWQTFAYPIYIFCILLLLLVLVIGSEVKGARSWFIFGGISFQPAELAKFGTALALSSYISYYKTDLKKTKNLFLAIGIFALPMLLILLQPDAGSALVFIAFSVILYREGVSGAYFLISLLFLILFISSLVFSIYTVIAMILLFSSLILLFNMKQKDMYFLIAIFALLATNVALIYLSFQSWLIYFNLIVIVLISALKFKQKKLKLVSLIWPVATFCVVLAFFSNYAFQQLQPHQQDRINVWLKPSECDPKGSLYNIIQSKMAIGSGGFQGKGFLNGTMTKLNYVPEQSTDFIFSTIGEEQGFIGSFAIIALFLMLIFRVIKLGERNKNHFVRHYAYGVAGILFIHFFINIGMTMGLAPIVGIPLPFISKGGSSLIAFTIMIAVLLRMDSSRY